MATIASCGACCSEDILCAKCEIATLRANGLAERLAPEITGLSRHSRSHSGFDKTTYGKLNQKLNELMLDRNNFK